MAATSRLIICSALLILTGCAAAPVQAPPPVPPPTLVMSSGLVIGTLSYQYIDTNGSSAMVVHFERIDAPSKQDYALVVELDPQRHKGVFSGPLPAGVYAFREVSSEQHRFSAAAMKIPFEVQAGEVKDTGHYALKPLEGI